MAETKQIQGGTIKWYGAEAQANVKKEMAFRMALAVEHVRSKVMRNVSLPSRQRRSKPGEYPRTDTGRLRNSIFGEVLDGGAKGIVGTNLKYALYLEFGVAGGKIIVPIRAKVLSWIDEATGERRFAKRVRQGAIEGRTFLRRTAFEEIPQVKMIFTRKLKDGVVR